MRLISRCAALAAALSIAAPAAAQNAPSYNGPGGTKVPAQGMVCIGLDGSVLACASPYGFTPLGAQQLTGVSTATGFTPPVGATYCTVQTDTVSVRYKFDGVNPTASVGSLLGVAPSQLVISGSALLSGFKAIPTSGSTILDIECFK